MIKPTMAVQVGDQVKKVRWQQDKKKSSVKYTAPASGVVYQKLIEAKSLSIPGD